ncbi:MAG: luciferase family protein, partial [uncultured Thermomicrobiales bacterium]
GDAARAGRSAQHRLPERQAPRRVRRTRRDCRALRLRDGQRLRRLAVPAATPGAADDRRGDAADSPRTRLPQPLHPPPGRDRRADRYSRRRLGRPRLPRAGARGLARLARDRRRAVADDDPRGGDDRATVAARRAARVQRQGLPTQRRSRPAMGGRAPGDSAADRHLGGATCRLRWRGGDGTEGRRLGQPGDCRADPRADRAGGGEGRARCRGGRDRPRRGDGRGRGRRAGAGAGPPGGRALPAGRRAARPDDRPRSRTADPDRRRRGARRPGDGGRAGPRRHPRSLRLRRDPGTNHPADRGDSRRRCRPRRVRHPARPHRARGAATAGRAGLAGLSI